MDIDTDVNFMKMALEQAKMSLDSGDFPVGAILLINNEVVGKERNLLRTNLDWISHAEMRLLVEYSSLIKKSVKTGASVTIYSTFEPCLMCLGSSILHRVSRIIYACPDPFTGATCITRESLPIGYDLIYPKIELGPLKKESQELLLTCMDQNPEKWKIASELLRKV